MESQSHRVQIEVSPFLRGLGVLLCCLGLVAAFRPAQSCCTCAPCACLPSIDDHHSGSIGSMLLSKAEGCPCCPNNRCPVITPLQPITPTAPSSAAIDRLHEKKTGQWCCESCRRSIVGSMMHTTYVDGEAITFLCQECWARKSPSERLQDFNRWISKQSQRSDASATAARSAVGNDR